MLTDIIRLASHARDGKPRVPLKGREQRLNERIGCGSQLIFDDKFYQKSGLWLCPVCDGYCHYNL